MILLPDNYWEVKNTKNKGRGIFAKKEIPKGKIIGDYLGVVLKPEETMVDESNFYLMRYHDHAVISPNLKKPGVHLLNNSCLPNCFIYMYYGHTLFFALRNIHKNEELTILYLLSPINKLCNPCLHICKCGSKNCKGTMHLSIDVFKKWRKLNEKQSRETKRERVSFGKELPMFSNYPKKIPEDYIREVTGLFEYYSFPSHSL